MSKLLKYLSGYRVQTVLGPLFKLIEAVFELIIPLVVAWMIDEGIALAGLGDYSVIIQGGVIILILGVLGLGFSLTAQFFASRASAGFGANLRGDLYAKINGLSAAELDVFSAPTLVTRLISDTTQTQNAVAMFIRLVTRAPFIVIGATVMAIIIDPALALIFVAAGLIVGVAPFLLMRLTRPGYRGVQQGLDDLTGKTREALSGQRVIRSFGREDDEQAAFGAAAQTLARRSTRVGALSAILNPFTYAVVNLSIIAILYFGGREVSYGTLTQGEVIALVNYLTQILHALIVFANLMVIFSKAAASAARINEVFGLSPSLVPGGGATPDETAPALTFNGVDFTYPGGGKPTLSGISFTLSRGKTLGILGGTGSGKTTLLSLIERLYDADSGEIRLFGHAVCDYAPDELASLIRVAPQKAVLFSGTVRDNLLWGKPDADDTALNAALDTAQALAFVREKPDGIETAVTAGGKNFSGGQRQRLSIARAVVGGAPLLILDDATSALDYQTEAKVRKGIKRLPGAPAVVMVSQRVTSVKSADLILVLDEGRVAGLGTHGKLLNECALYREIYQAQTKGVSV